MSKKLLFVALLIAAVGSLPLYAQKSKERTPALPKDLARYENEYPMELFKNAAVKKRLRTLLGKNYNSFIEAIDTQEPMEKNGGLLVGKGCAQGLCTIYEAMIVIDLSAKTIHCGIVNIATKTKYRNFSESLSNFPVVLKDWANKLLQENQ